MNIQKYDIVWVDLSPTKGSEQKGICPFLILQNNLANQSKLSTYTGSPITSKIKNVPSGIIVQASFENQLTSDSRIELSQIRTIDGARIIKKGGTLEGKYWPEIQEKMILFFDIYDEF
jgi:mRNA interferase MazF